jgi:hypothetical protein
MPDWNESPALKHKCGVTSWGSDIIRAGNNLIVLVGRRSTVSRANSGQEFPSLHLRRCCWQHVPASTEPRFNKSSLMIWLCTLTFAKDCGIEVIQSLGAVFVVSRMTQLSPLAATSFRLSEGSAFLNKKLCSALKPALRPFAECLESRIDRRPTESNRATANNAKYS